MQHDGRILVVDDEIVIRELMVDILLDEGFEVISVGSGLEALEQIKACNDIVVLFTDIMMPEMDGIELIREARKLRPTIVPLVMTGYATLDTARAAVKEGAYDYVLKPFNINEIKMAVESALERHRLEAETARYLEISELFKISESLASIRDEDTLLDFVLSAALERVGAQRGSLMLTTDDGNNLVVSRSLGLPKDFLRSKADMNNSISGMVARQMQPLLVEDINDYPDLITLCRSLESNSFISVPLERKSSPLEDTAITGIERPRVIAVLNVTNKNNGAKFSESDLKTLSIVGNHAAAALQTVQLIREIENTQREIVFTLGGIVETRSRETGNHVKRVAEYSRIIGLKCGLSQVECDVLRLAAPLHDVGKVGIPDAILNKPGKLTDEEYEIIKTHCKMGHDMLRNTKGRIMKSAAVIALQHHEYWDGSGYPNGLAGEDIHIFGRITGIADVFDALGEKRVYKDAWSLNQILDYFIAERGKHFDPTLIDVFFAALDDIIAIRDEFKD